MTKFEFTNHLTYPDMSSVTTDSGSRQYETPDGPAASVTTILSTLPHPGLDEWRERVGNEEADRISKEATTIGSAMHDMLEDYVLTGNMKDFSKFPDIPEVRMAKKMFKMVRMSGLRKVNKVWAVEVPLHCFNLYAGRTDLICEYDGISSIVDYKTSRGLKPADYLKDYKLQCAMYTIAHNLMFPQENIRQGVLVIGVRPNEQFNITPRIQTEIIGYDELAENQFKALEIVYGFHCDRGTMNDDMLDKFEYVYDHLEKTL